MLLLFSIILKKLNVLLIGFGNLGYRHFQSIYSEFSNAKFYIIETEINNIKNFIEKDYDFTNLSKKLIVTNLLEEFININFNLCIVSTPSLPRFDILQKLLKFNIELIILEKLLFPSYEYYERLENNLNIIPNNIFVNCPKREYSFYSKIKSNIIKNQKINITCSNILDIGSNSIHWIDLAYFLTSRKIDIKDKFKINISELYPSKRKGYYDFTGNVNVESSFFNLSIKSSIPNNTNYEEEFLLTFGNSRFKVNETKSNLYSNVENIQSKMEINVPYQSQLTSEYLKSFEKGNLKLTNFHDSFLIHRKFFLAFEEAILNVKNKNYYTEKDYFLT